MPNRTRIVMAGTLLLVLTGCDLTQRRSAAVTGSWRLDRVGGHRLPAPVEGRSQLLGGSLELSADGSFTESEAWTYVSHGVSAPRAPAVARGRWDMAGRTVTLHMSDGGVGSARLRDDKLVMDVNGRSEDTWVYQRVRR
jgi:hypothetical protein